MKKNMGAVDRVVRLILVALIVVLYFTKVISGVLAIVLGIIAVIFLVTGIIGFCGLYVPLKLSTRKDQQ